MGLGSCPRHPVQLGQLVCRQHRETVGGDQVDGQARTHAARAAPPLLQVGLVRI